MPTRGVEVYDADSTPVTARGASLRDEDIAALPGRLDPILRDESGSAALASLLDGIDSTGFDPQVLQEVLSPIPSVESWRVGEAIGEAFLTDHRHCHFPWPGTRDLKNPSSSPGGTDLVGFQETATFKRFAFGEVKTSRDPARPPSVVTGRHGLVAQLEALRDQSVIRSQLVRYLGHHAPGRNWQPVFKEATEAYLRDPHAIALFGIIVREVEPDARDLTARAGRLAAGCPPGISIELRAIYLPGGTIAALVQSMVGRGA
jgi:hypothetical protein